MFYAFLVADRAWLCSPMEKNGRFCSFLSMLFSFANVMLMEYYVVRWRSIGWV